MSWITHQTKPILYIDLRNKSEDEIIRFANEAKDLLISTKKADNLRLINVEGAFGNKVIMDELKRVGTLTKPYWTKTAIVGVSGMKSILLKAYNAIVKGNTKSFDMEYDAKEWLILP